jgi:aminobenzoyl-glutamate transport protein
MSQASDAPKTAMQKTLDVVERVDNKVPHPAVIFLVLIAIVVVFSHVLNLAGASVTTEVIVPVEKATSEKSLDAYPYSEELFEPTSR